MNARPRPPHGTWQRYALKSDPCRNQCCRIPWNRYRNQRDLAILTGARPVDPLVDPAPVARHIHTILDRNPDATLNGIALTAGVTRPTLSAITAGHRKYIRASIAARILATDDATSTRTPGFGVRRRLQALRADGWGYHRLGRELGCSHDNVRQLTLGYNDTVFPSTAAAVADLYRRLTALPRPEGQAASRARNDAAAAGWYPSLAWDDDTIDDPDHEPEWTFGERPQRTRAETLEDIRFILSTDSRANIRTIADRLGVTPNAIDNIIRLLNADDVRATLAARNGTPYPSAPRRGATERTPA